MKEKMEIFGSIIAWIAILGVLYWLFGGSLEYGPR